MIAWSRRGPAAGLLVAGLLSAGAAVSAGEAPAALLDEGERLLATGDTEAAVAVLERAATTGHLVAVELMLVRAHMQAGHYELAVAAAAHVAGEHADVPGAAGLHAWLLSLGGQREAAARLLNEALAARPDDPLLRLERRLLAEPLPVSSGLLLDAPHRMAPPDAPIGRVGGDGPARVVSSAVLMGGGRRALAPTITAGTSLWVRDGLGRSSEAWIDPAPAPEGVDGTFLCLARALGPGLPMARGPAPFAGSPAIVIGFARGANRMPAWPVLRYGFFGAMETGDSPMRRLAVDLGPDALGSLVFDATGRWVGLAAAELPSGNAGMTSVVLPAGAVTAASAATKTGTASVSKLYERGLRAVVQVIERPGTPTGNPASCADHPES